MKFPFKVVSFTFSISFLLSVCSSTLPAGQLQLEYSTFLGGSDADEGRGIKVGTDGRAYVIGITESSDFPTESPYQAGYGGGDWDVFVSALSTSGSSLYYSTYLGGSGNDEGHGISVGTDGRSYVIGETESSDFPMENPYQAGFGGGDYDVFVSALSSTGSDLYYSTYLGGSDTEGGYGISLGMDGTAYVTGFTGSSDFPTENPYQAEHGGGIYDVFVTALSSTGSALYYSTYLGGSGVDYGNGISLGTDGAASVTGLTSSFDFPTENPYQAVHDGGSYDVFVTALSSTGSALSYSTYLGGSDWDTGYGISLGTDGRAYVTGKTKSTDFPTENPYQAGYEGGTWDAFVTALSSTGSALFYSTYFGGSSFDYGYGISVGPDGAASATGLTYSTDFPTENPYQARRGGISNGDVFVSALTSTGSALFYSTYLGGSSFDKGYGISVGADGRAYVTGKTNSTDFPMENPYQAGYGGSYDAFITVLYVYNSPTPTLTPTPTPVGYKTPTPTPSLIPTPTISPTRTPPPSPTPAGLSIPFSEDFEGVWSGGAPELWTKEYVSGTHNWEKASGGQDGHPPSAHGGTYNALFYRADFTMPVIRLISPPLNFVEKTSNTRLTFWHAMEVFGEDQDELSVYYRSSEFDPWSLLVTYNSSLPNWTQRTVSLPNPSNDYFICFEGTAKWGYGVCIDDVLVTGDSADSSSPILDSGDYNGDGTSDIAIFRPGNGMWSVRGITRAYFGSSADLPVPGDYNGDGATDIGIFRPGSGLWGIRGLTRIYFGSSSDVPMPGDYDGDGTSEVGIFRGSSGLWSIRGVTRIYYGGGSDTAVPGDYDGDGKKNIAVFRPASGMWAIQGMPRVYFGSSSDTVVPGDYNGDGTWEAAIFRSATGMWGIRGVTRTYYGSSSDQPVPADYNGDSKDEMGIFRGSSGLWGIRNISRVYFGTVGDVPVTR